jgi:hypothetical protein
VGGYVINMGAVIRSARGALLVAGSALLIGLSTANAQIGGAVQYPPASVGEDAQPPPPAGMAPQSMSPRRIELGVSGSSERSDDSIRSFRARASPTPPPTVGGK